MQLLRKITTATVAALCSQLNHPFTATLETGENKKLLFTVAGIARDTKAGESSFGPWMALRGEFGVVVPGLNEQIRSPQVFFPEPYSGMLIAAVQEIQSKGEKANVQFAASVYATRDPKKLPKLVDGKTVELPVNYVYHVEPIIKPQESDTLSMLMEEAIKQLPASVDVERKTAPEHKAEPAAKPAVQGVPKVATAGKK